jgi:hypothetical protein
VAEGFLGRRFTGFAGAGASAAAAAVAALLRPLRSCKGPRVSARRAMAAPEGGGGGREVSIPKARTLLMRGALVLQ